MADAVASVDPAALADVIRRCEAAVASWDLGDIETRAVLGESADFRTAIRDAAPLVLAVERRVRDATRSASSSGAASSPREARVARSAEDDDSDETRGSSPCLSPPPTPAAANARRGATVVELCGPERGHVLGWLVRALLPVEAVEEVVLVDRARPPRREDGDDGATTTTTTSDERDETSSRLPRVTYHRANVKNGSHLRSLARFLRVATHCGDRGAIVFVARALSGTETLRACQLFDASYEKTSPSRENVSDVSVPSTLLLEPGDAPPKEESLKGKLLFRIARAHACAARQLYPAPRKDKAAATSRSSDEPGALGANAAAKKNKTRDEKEKETFVAERSARRERRDADAAFRFFRHVVAGLRKTPGSLVDEFVVRAGETRETRFAVARRDVAVGDSSDAFGPVARTVTEQMADLNAAVARRLGERGGYVGPEALAAVASEPPRRASTDAPRADDAGPPRDVRRPFFAFGSPPRLLAGRDADDGADDAIGGEQFDVAGFLLRRVPPSRWTEGGYAAEHYVKPDPEPHGVCYEAVGVDARGFEAECPYDEVQARGDSDAERVGLGFVAVAAHERGDAEEDSEFINSSDEFINSSSSLGRVLTNAQIERLCVKTGFRGVGVAQTLLRVADGFHKCGVPVRIKTASEKAFTSFSNMPALLKFIGFKDPTTAGVSKARGVRTVVVVDDVEEYRPEEESGNRRPGGGVERSVGNFRHRWRADDDDARAYEKRGWGKKDASEDDARRDVCFRAETNSCPIDWAVRETTAAMNRTAPDTVDACAARVTRALRGAESPASFGDGAEAEARKAAAAAAAGAAFARRAAREPTYASTHAKVLRRVDSEQFRAKAAETTLRYLRRLSKRADPRETPDMFDAEGFAAFAAALGALESDENVSVVRETETERARVTANVAATLSELCDVAETSSASLFALCAAVEHGAFCGAERDVVNSLSEDAEKIAEKILARLRSVASRRDPRVGGATFAFPARARFAAERACVKLCASREKQTREYFFAESRPIVGHSETRASFAENARVGFGLGRGRALSRNEPARSRAETHASAVAEAAGKLRRPTCGGTKTKNDSEASARVRVPVAPPLTIAVAGSVAAVERGMRQGWVFQYAGSPVAPSDDAYWTR
jgi:hypothetical protein